MTSFILSVMFFCQILEVDSIISPGAWTNPESILVSDDLYALPAGNEDSIILSISDPIDTLTFLDSVKVYLEQHVSDTSKAFWYLTPIINGLPGTSTPKQAGTFIDSLLCFDISADITGWKDLIGLHVELRPKKGTGAPPDWYADYLYVYVYSTIGILEEESDAQRKDSKLSIPTLTRKEISFSYYLNTQADILIEIFNIAGIKVVNKWVNGRSGTNSITLKEIGCFQSGVYYLRIKSINQRCTQETKSAKFIVLN